MADLFFVLRIFFATIAIVVLLQIKIDESTLEDRAQNWMRSSSAVDALREVSAGAVKMASQGYQSILSMIDKNMGSAFNREQMAGSRHLGWELGRSQAYTREQEAKRKAAEAAAKRGDDRSLDADEPRE